MGRNKTTKVKYIEQIKTVTAEGCDNFDRKVNRTLRDIQNKGGEILYIVPDIGWRINEEPGHEDVLVATIVYYENSDLLQNRKINKEKQDGSSKDCDS